MIRMLIFFFCYSCTRAVIGSTSFLEHEELGMVHWNRSFNTSLELSKKSGKPVLLLFQEIPGCSTCRNYGRNVLSDPMMVEIIEDQFVPCVVFNNKGGEDKLILQRYNEASWNNPVVRIVDAKGKDIIPRHANDYSVPGLLTSMRTALNKYGRKIPGYMQLYHSEQRGKAQEQTAYYSMFCFWSGEGHLGSCKGVIATDPGFMNSREVVRVTYNEAVLSLEALTKHAKASGCALMQEATGYRSDKDPQYYLKQSVYKYIPLTPMQRTKINSALALKKDPSALLSPKQKSWVGKIKAGDQILYDQPFKEGWTKKLKATN